MAHDEAKMTAEAAAAARAAGWLDPRFGNPDDLAIELIGPAFRAMLLPGARKLTRVFYERLLPGMFMYHQARTPCLDAQWRDALEAGARQMVILGAGFDTRAHRLNGGPNGDGRARVFEVDHPATSAKKRAAIQRLGRSPHGARVAGDVVYVTVDFTRERLDERLVAAGFAFDQRTFFLWEGVMMYLPRASIDDVLAVVARAAAGSTIAFDYAYAAALTRPADFVGGRETIAYVKRKNEPFLFGVDPADVGALLAPHRLEVAKNFDAAELRRVFAPRVSRPMCDFFGVAVGKIGA